MEPVIRHENGYQYVEQGQGEPMVLLHGLFGALSNFAAMFAEFSDRYRVIIPLMPIYEKTDVPATVEGLTDFIEGFIDFKGLENCVLVGNSLGGHVGLVYTLRRPEKVAALTLTGSSGLFESGMGSGFPRRSSYEYVRERVAYTFYSPATATKELVDEVFGIINDNYKTLRILNMARSAQRQNLSHLLHQIKTPTLLIWGLNDNITPPRVGHEFHKLIANSELCFIDQCGHAAMMEQSTRFNALLADFLNRKLKPIPA
jgi:pimeloyl-ACP methyl ester carboxylesterase